MTDNTDLAAQIACVEREIRMRQRVYPRWVGGGKMTQAKADAEISAMEAVHATLVSLRQPPKQGSLLDG